MEGILQLIVSISERAELIMGINPVYMIPVFVIVAIISRPLSVRERFPRYRNLILGLLAFTVGVGVTFLFEDYETWRLYVKNGFILGAVSALTYQIFKPIFRALILKLFKVVNERTGSEIKDDDLLV